MDAVLYGAAVASFLVAAVFYFRGWFRIAFALGFVFWALVGHLLTRTMPPAAAWSLFVLFGIGPATFLVVHAIDARKGYFRLPTVYSIPFAFIFGLLLLLCAGIGVLFA